MLIFKIQLESFANISRAISIAAPYLLPLQNLLQNPAWDASPIIENLESNVILLKLRRYSDESIFLSCNVAMQITVFYNRLQQQLNRI